MLQQNRQALNANPMGHFDGRRLDARVSRFNPEGVPVLIAAMIASGLAD